MEIDPPATFSNQNKQERFINSNYVPTIKRFSYKETRNAEIAIPLPKLPLSVEVLIKECRKSGKYLISHLFNGYRCYCFTDDLELLKPDKSSCLML